MAKYIIHTLKQQLADLDDRRKIEAEKEKLLAQRESAPAGKLITINAKIAKIDSGDYVEEQKTNIRQARLDILEYIGD